MYKRHTQGKQPKFNQIPTERLLDQTDKQSKRITDALKLQNKQSQQYSKEYISHIKGKAVAELQHNRELKKLKDDVFDVSLENHEIRAKREVESLLGKSKEAGKRADDWQHFSTTRAAQFAKAGASLLNTAQNIQADTQTKKLRTEYADEYERLTGESATLNNLYGVNSLKEKLAILRDPSLSDEEKYEGISKIFDIDDRLNHPAQLSEVNNLLGRWGSIKEDLKRQAGQRNIPWNADTVPGLYELRAGELLRGLGISSTSKAGKRLLEGVEDKLLPELEKLTKTKNINIDLGRAKTLRNKGKSFIGNKYKDKREWELNYANEIIHYDKSHYRNHKDEVIAPASESNLNAAQEAIMEDYVMSGAFNSYDQAERYLLGSKTPDKVGDEWKITEWTTDQETSEEGKLTDYWGGRYDDKQDRLIKIWTEYESIRGAQSEENLAKEDSNHLLKLKERASLPVGDENRFDITNTAQVTEALKLHTQHKNTTKWLSDSQIFKFDNNKNLENITKHLQSLYDDGKTTELAHYIQYLPPETSQNWYIALKDLEDLANNNMSATEITEASTNLLAAVVKVNPNSLEQLTHYTTPMMIPIVDQDFRNEYRKIGVADKDGVKDSFQKITEAWANVSERLTNGTGPYSRDTTAGAEATVWNLLTPEPDKDGLSNTYIQKKILDDPKVGIENLIKELKVDRSNNEKGQFSGEYFLPKDAVDNIEYANIYNRNIPTIDAIEYLYKNQKGFGTNKQKWKKHDLYNEIFKAIGIDAVVPPGDESHSENIVKNSNINVSRFSNYSPLNQMNIALALELTNLNGGNIVISNTLDPNHQDFFLNKENKRMNYSYFR